MALIGDKTIVYLEFVLRFFIPTFAIFYFLFDSHNTQKPNKTIELIERKQSSKFKAKNKCSEKQKQSLVQPSSSIIKSATVRLIKRRFSKNVANQEEEEEVEPQTSTTTIVPVHNGIGLSQDKQLVIKSSTKLPNLAKLCTFYNYFAAISCTLMFLKYALILTLDSPKYQHLNYISCFMPGRITSTAAHAKVMPYFAAFIYGFMTLVRIAALTQRKSRIEVIEFLLFKYNEIRTIERTRRNSSLNFVSGFQETGRFESIYGSRQLDFLVSDINAKSGTGASAGDDASSGQSSKIIHYQLLEFEQFNNVNNSDSNYCNCKGGDGCSSKYSMKLNRGSDAWLLLAKSFVSIVVGAFFAVLLMCILHTRLSLPLVITLRGFSFTYWQCAEWLRDTDNETRHRFEFIHQNRLDYSQINATTHKFFMPFNNFIELNWYHSLRLCADVTENICFYTFLIIGSMASISYSTMILLDHCYYIWKIQLRLNQTLVKLRLVDRDLVEHSRFIKQRSQQHQNHQHSQHNTRLSLPPISPLRHSSNEEAANKRSTSSFVAEERHDDCSFMYHHNHHHHGHNQANLIENNQLAATQWMLIDLFKQIRVHNSYQSASSTLLIAVWIIFSIIVSYFSCLSDRYIAGLSITTWYLTYLGGSIYTLAILSSSSIVEQRSRKLYNSINSCMALDFSIGGRKSMWRLILDHFYPEPMYCFRLYDRIRIQWMLVIKLASWFLTFLLITFSFVRVYWANE